MPLHDDEIEIDEASVRALVDRAVPEFVDHPLSRLGVSGSSNTLYRLGEDYLVRLPRQPGGTGTIAKEARWVPYLATALPAAVPEVVAVGEPGFGYPERWSIVRWIDGHTPNREATAGAASGLPRELAAVVATLRELPVPAAALEDPELQSYRGGPLAAVDAATRSNLADCRRLPELDLDLDACARVWDAAAALPGFGDVAGRRWLHGDLLAENVLVHGDRLTAVLDFGGLAVGDPTVDLIIAWELLDQPQRALFRSALDVDEPTWQRARAWALAIAVMTFPYYWRTMPDRCAARLDMARAVLDDFSA
jgi:aminoglycoside phosphotransferase (APT) family kinase protein